MGLSWHSKTGHFQVGQHCIRVSKKISNILIGDDCWPRWTWRTEPDNATRGRNARTFGRRKSFKFSSKLRISRGSHQRRPHCPSAQCHWRFQLWSRSHKQVVFQEMQFVEYFFAQTHKKPLLYQIQWMTEIRTSENLKCLKIRIQSSSVL